jgi:thiamine-monophosphate kinase
MSEFALIDRFFKRVPRDAAVRIGIGDDAAVITPSAGMELAASVDMLVEGRHFLQGSDPVRLGHKTLAVNLSDMAAMGATPRWALLAGALPDEDPEWIAAFMSGFEALATAFNVELVGGDTTRGPRNLCVTILGEVPAGTALTRVGANVGDDVYVSGTLGDAAAALAGLTSRTRFEAETLATLRLRLEAPTPRVALGSTLRGIATSCIDVSDGLVGDLGHILEASSAGAHLSLALIPRHPAVDAKLAGPERSAALQWLLAGGDDYELCFTAPRATAGRIEALAKELALPLTRIGMVRAERDLVVDDERGRPLASLPRPFDHFG